jgi:ABC-type Zn2+ transport system substrate-binding protein/surface adhesin
MQPLTLALFAAVLAVPQNPTNTVSRTTSAPKATATGKHDDHEGHDHDHDHEGHDHDHEGHDHDHEGHDHGKHTSTKGASAYPTVTAPPAARTNSAEKTSAGLMALGLLLL